MHYSRKTFSLLLVFAFLFVISPVCAKPNSIHFINLRWELDARQWKPLNYYIHGPQGIIQYLPEGQQIENWSEMVSMQWYENANLSAKAHFDELVRGLRNIWPTQKINSNVLLKTNLALLGEWWTDGDVNNKPRYGLAKIFAVNGDIYVLTYTTCEPTIVPHVKRNWINILKQATLNYAELEREVAQ